MVPSIRSVMDECVMATIDAKLVKKIHLCERSFVNANEEHVAFFGGNLMGVHPVRFKSSDREYWLNEIAEADELDIEDGLKAVAKVDPKTLNPEWIRANDAVNLTCVYLAHRFMNETKLSPKDREAAAIDCFLMLQYKFVTSLMAHYFRYPADEATMQAAYAELSRKYALKAAGSWSALLEQRAKDLISPRSIHYRTLMNFNNNKDIVYMVSDIQGRLKEMVKSMSAVFYRVKEQGMRIGVDRAVMDVDGEIVLKDKSRQYSSLINYINDIVDDRASFVKLELVSVITDAMHTVSPKLLVETLEWVSANYRVRNHQYLEEFTNETLLYAFDLISADRSLYAKDSGLGPLLTKLRSLYMASRMSDPVLLKTKALSERIVSQAVKSRNPSVVASVRTALQMYIVCRALAKRYYQN